MNTKERAMCFIELKAAVQGGKIAELNTFKVVKNGTELTLRPTVTELHFSDRYDNAKPLTD